MVAWATGLCPLVSPLPGPHVFHSRPSIQLPTRAGPSLPDGDALPDPHWLRYLALRFMEHQGNATWAAVGGRSLAPLGYGTVADSLAYAPGGAGGRGWGVLCLNRQGRAHPPGPVCVLAPEGQPRLGLGAVLPQDQQQQQSTPWHGCIPS